MTLMFTAAEVRTQIPFGKAWMKSIVKGFPTVAGKVITPAAPVTGVPVHEAPVRLKSFMVALAIEVPTTILCKTPAEALTAVVAAVVILAPDELVRAAASANWVARSRVVMIPLVKALARMRIWEAPGMITTEYGPAAATVATGCPVVGSRKRAGTQVAPASNEISAATVATQVPESTTLALLCPVRAI